MNKKTDFAEPSKHYEKIPLEIVHFLNICLT